MVITQPYIFLTISTDTVTLTVSLLTLNETLQYNGYYRHFENKTVLYSYPIELQRSKNTKFWSLIRLLPIEVCVCVCVCVCVRGGVPIFWYI